MADSREIGLRVGAAANQAVAVAVSLIGSNQLGGDPKEVATYIEELAPHLLVVMNDLQASEAVKAGFGGTVPAPATQQAAAAAPRPASSPASAVSGYNTEFSGSTKPLKLSEHPELDGWLHAQCTAISVYDVWDNRGKDAYKAAIAKGEHTRKDGKTPPPFRSATDGIDKSFWPPK